MSSTTTTTQIATKPSKTSIKHLSPKASTSSLPAPQKLITHQDSLSSSKSASIITNVVPASNCLSPQASFSRDDARGALMTAILNSIEGGGGDDRATRGGVSRSDTVSGSTPSLTIDTRFFWAVK